MASIQSTKSLLLTVEQRRRSRYADDAKLAGVSGIHCRRASAVSRPVNQRPQVHIQLNADWSKYIQVQVHSRLEAVTQAAVSTAIAE